MESERLARVEEKCERIPYIENKLDAFIAAESLRHENDAKRKGKLDGMMLTLSAFVSMIVGWWAGHR